MQWHVKCRQKRTIADYAHRRPKMHQRTRAERPLEGEVGHNGEGPPARIDKHRQHFYYGLHTTNVTQHLGCAPPSHSYNPALIDKPPPCYNRKSSSITEDVLGPVHVKRFDPSLPDAWYNRKATDVTDQLRFVPPSHAMGSDKPDPWYGRARTYVTNPDCDDYSMYQVKYEESQAKRHLERERRKQEKRHDEHNVSNVKEEGIDEDGNTKDDSTATWHGDAEEVGSQYDRHDVAESDGRSEIDIHYSESHHLGEGRERCREPGHHHDQDFKHGDGPETGSHYSSDDLAHRGGGHKRGQPKSQKLPDHGTSPIKGGRRGGRYVPPHTGTVTAYHPPRERRHERLQYPVLR
ncbi:hypothetical protein KP509_13G077300 [Ceratopteris richardii]|nr:hypothetical protein KP509_13G077300 [Ceratopteris richardii]KAH7421826.1 hypothetical protein KP509_13G077300 [Ceratopteris richardii]KAH7421828.1 hypothetical protein KP509_13G077300 [Ceratopteris richardii]